MTSANMDARVRSLHEFAPLHISLVCLGAGAGIQDLLWAPPGASAIIASCDFPYDDDSIGEYLGFDPPRFCCSETAVDLAMEAYRRAWRWDQEGEAIGVGLTAVAATHEKHRGDHRVHVGVFGERKGFVFSGILPKEAGESARREDGNAANELGLNAILTYLGMPQQAPDRFIHLQMDGMAGVDNAALQARPFFGANGRRGQPAPAAALFPGAFNPPHKGHFGIAAAVARLGYEPVFEVTMDLPHKDPLQPHEALQRVKQLRGHDVWLSSGMPLYADKAKQWQGPIVLGVDAFTRMLDPAWCNDPTALLLEMFDHGARFLLAGRQLPDASGWLKPEDVVKDCVPVELQGMIECLPGRWDVSSSEVRARLGNGN